MAEHHSNGAAISTRTRPCWYVWGLLAGIGCLFSGSWAVAQNQASSFDRTIAPILVNKCLSCHSGGNPKGGLDLTTVGAARKGGESGVAIVPRDLNASLLWRRVN
ncbi:MAG: c-type cytochrome domain-containing protein, partial [Planctomycetaceae bacterium]